MMRRGDRSLMMDGEVGSNKGRGGSRMLVSGRNDFVFVSNLL